MQPGILIKLDRERTLRMTVRALDRAEQKMGRPLSDFDENKPFVRDMVTLCWAGLVHEDPSLTFDQVFDYIDEHSTMETINEKVNEAIALAKGQSDEKNGRTASRKKK